MILYRTSKCSASLVRNMLLLAGVFSLEVDQLQVCLQITNSVVSLLTYSSSIIIIIFVMKASQASSKLVEQPGLVNKFSSKLLKYS